MPTDTKTHLSDKYDFSSTIDKPRTTLELSLNPPLELLPQAYTIVKDNYIEERGREKYGSKGSWSLFLARLGVEGHVDTNTEATIFVTERLETSFFPANLRISREKYACRSRETLS